MVSSLHTWTLNCHAMLENSKSGEQFPRLSNASWFFSWETEIVNLQGSTPQLQHLGDASSSSPHESSSSVFPSGPLVLTVFAGVSGHLGPTLIGSIRRVHRRTIFGSGFNTGATVDLVGPRAIQQTWGKVMMKLVFGWDSYKLQQKQSTMTCLHPLHLYISGLLTGFKPKLRQK